LALKKELKNKNDYESSLKKELAQKSKKIAELKSTLESQSRELKILTDANQVRFLFIQTERIPISIVKISELPFFFFSLNLNEITDQKAHFLNQFKTMG
jgi:hypothetical protein